ncbi:MAG: hypothetical protein HYX92_12315 [Chloroflexi bacterium]|nr:hypothetical protein [Chloroflexota bacterium]
MNVNLQARRILKEEAIVEASVDKDGLIAVLSEPDAERVFEEFINMGWADGLPIIPPTERRVLRMLEQTKRSPDEVLGKMPPVEVDVTVELIAINAVMAGCAPEYFPLVLAAMEAALDPRFNLRQAICTAFTSWPVMIVNGPAIKELSLNHGWGVLGSGFRPNATIGRALTLCATSVGGLRPGFGENKHIGTPLRYGLCIAEDEEASDLLPLHVELGFNREDSVLSLVELANPVTLHSPTSTASASPAGWLGAIARSVAEAILIESAGPEFGREGTKQLLIVPPLMAQKLAKDGWTKDDIRHFLYENARVPRAEIHRRRTHPTISPDVIDTELKLRYETVPRWVRAQMTEPADTALNDLIPMMRKPEDLLIIAVGPRISNCQGAIFPGHDHFQEVVSRKIET